MVCGSRVAADRLRALLFALDARSPEDTAAPHPLGIVLDFDTHPEPGRVVLVVGASRVRFVRFDEQPAPRDGARLLAVVRVIRRP